jgi:hypothetical protein
LRREFQKGGAKKPHPFDFTQQMLACLVVTIYNLELSGKILVRGLQSLWGLAVNFLKNLSPPEKFLKSA